MKEGRKMNGKKAWTITIVAVLCFMVNSTSEQRVPPLLPVLTDQLGLNLVQGGWLMSAYGIASCLISVPAAYFLMKLRPKLSMAVAISSTAIGAIIGTFSENYPVLLVGRVLDGLGTGFIAVVVASIIAEWFTPDKRGLPNAVMLGSYPVACLTMLNIAAPLESRFSWHGIWGLGIILGSLVLLAALFLIPNNQPYSESFAAQQNSENIADLQNKEKIKLSIVLKAAPLWLVFIAFNCFDIGFYGLTTYMPTLMVDTLGAPLATANGVVSLLMVVMIPSSILCGYLLGKVKNRRFLPAFGLAGLTVVLYGSFNSTSLPMAIAFMLAGGFFTAFIPSSLFTIGAETIANPAYIGICVAITSFGQNMGVAVGPLYVGTIVESSGNVWTSAAIPSAIVTLIGAVCCLLIKTKDNKVYNQEYWTKEV